MAVDVESIERTLELYPGRSLWIPETHEFVVVSPWRHRNEIASVQSISAARHPETLLSSAVETARAEGAEAFVVMEWSESRPDAFYQRVGLGPLESVIAYEHRDPRTNGPTNSDVTMRKADLTAGDEDFEHVMRIDRGAFPWLWWNSESEFRNYWFSPGVQLWIAETAGGPCGYIGFTSFAGWGHLDRVAVSPERQSHGIGTAMILHAMSQLRLLGAQRVGLSTQEDNKRSRQLYERIGFRRVREHDYRIFGRIFRAANAGEYSLEKVQVANEHE